MPEKQLPDLPNMYLELQKLRNLTLRPLRIMRCIRAGGLLTPAFLTLRQENTEAMEAEDWYTHCPRGNISAKKDRGKKLTDRRRDC